MGLANLLEPAKKALRGPYRTLRARYIRWRHGFGPDELSKALEEVGIRSGDAVLMHSAITGFAGFSGSVSDIVAALEQVIREEGTLLMPALSMTGSAIEFALSGKVFNVRTTPSQVGLLTEVFRRSPGVVRSVHPTHSVSAWGADTAWWIENHHLADTPCGKGTPFHRLLERGGKIVLAGVGITAMTFYHCIEELLESRMPESPFTTERYVMKCKSDGNVFESAEMRLYSPEVSRRRRLQPLEAELKKTGRWRESRTGTLTVIALDASEVLSTVAEMADRGVFCYERP